MHPNHFLKKTKQTDFICLFLGPKDGRRTSNDQLFWPFAQFTSRLFDFQKTVNKHRCANKNVFNIKLTQNTDDDDSLRRRKGTVALNSDDDRWLCCWRSDLSLKHSNFPFFDIKLVKRVLSPEFGFRQWIRMWIYSAEFRWETIERRMEEPKRICNQIWQSSIVPLHLHDRRTSSDMNQ